MPARLRAIAQVLRDLGIEVEKPSSGSHWKAVRGHARYPLPAHNGPKTEISDVYVRALCRYFDLDLVDFKRRL